MSPRAATTALNFTGMRQTDVPQGRNGKHKAIVTKILSDLDQIQKGVALKVPLAELSDSKEKVRSALNRATVCSALSMRRFSGLSSSRFSAAARR